MLHRWTRSAQRTCVCTQLRTATWALSTHGRASRPPQRQSWRGPCLSGLGRSTEYARLVSQRPAARLALLAPAGHVEKHVRLQQCVAVERRRRRLQHGLPATASTIVLV